MDGKRREQLKRLFSSYGRVFQLGVFMHMSVVVGFFQECWVLGFFFFFLVRNSIFFFLLMLT